jgi:hypothetical protein
MDIIRQVKNLVKRLDTTEQLSVSLFAVVAAYAIAAGAIHTLLVGAAFVLIVLGLMPKNVTLAFLVGASALVLVQTRRMDFGEGFQDGSGGSGVGEAEPEATAGSPKAMEEAAAKDAAEKAQAEKFSGGKPMLPDNADRKEMLELGKPYKLPSENDDKGYHLDAGTTFLNAYKALKPDQIASMTRDTQELLATQKSLMGMLDTFGPILKDMNKITGMFGPSQ